jgi:hypothetical protein
MQASRFSTSGFQNREWPGDVGADIVKRIVHGFDVADAAGQIERNVVRAPVRASGRSHVSASTTRNVLDGIDVEVIAAAGRIEGIDDSDGRAQLHKPDREIAANETETAGYEDFLGAIVIHTGSRRTMTRLHQARISPISVC